MALTTAYDFGEFVVLGDGGSVPGMGNPQEFSDTPLLRTGLKMGAAHSYQLYLLGEHGAIGAVLPDNFVNRSVNITDNLVLDRVDKGQRARWDANESIRGSFRDQLRLAIVAYGS